MTTQEIEEFLNKPEVQHTLRLVPYIATVKALLFDPLPAYLNPKLARFLVEVATPRLK